MKVNGLIKCQKTKLETNTGNNMILLVTFVINLIAGLICYLEAIKDDDHLWKKCFTVCIVLVIIMITTHCNSISIINKVNRFPNDYKNKIVPISEKDILNQKLYKQRELSDDYVIGLFVSKDVFKVEYLK